MRIIKFIHTYVHCRTQNNMESTQYQGFCITGDVSHSRSTVSTFHINPCFNLNFFNIFQTVPCLTRYLSVSHITFMSTMDSAKHCVFYLYHFSLVAKQIALAVFENAIIDVVTNVYNSGQICICTSICF